MGVCEGGGGAHNALSPKIYTTSILLLLLLKCIFQFTINRAVKKSGLSAHIRKIYPKMVAAQFHTKVELKIEIEFEAHTCAAKIR